MCVLCFAKLTHTGLVSAVVSVIGCIMSTHKTFLYCCSTNADAVTCFMLGWIANATVNILVLMILYFDLR